MDPKDKEWAEARFGPLANDEMLEAAMEQYEADWASLEAGEL